MKRWRDALADKQIGRDVLHPMRGLFEFRKRGERDVRQAWLGTTKQVRERRAVFAESKPVTLVDFRRQGYADWFKEGTAFGEGPSEEQTMLSDQGMPTAVRQRG